MSSAIFKKTCSHFLKHPIYCFYQGKHDGLHFRFFHKDVVRWSSRADYRMAPNVFRQKKMYNATVLDVFSASSSIKILRIHVREPGVSFKAGQWVDFYVPGIVEVTGYSMTSAPTEAKEQGILELAVKYGKFPPTDWVHNICNTGDAVQIRVGGDFFYDPFSNPEEAEANLLLIGGGVGFNPLVSILLEYRDLLQASQSRPEATTVNPGKVHLLYSAKTEDGLIFKGIVQEIEKEHPNLTAHYFVTAEQEDESRSDIIYSRINETHVANCIRTLSVNRTLCYICGPSTMTDDVAAYLIKLGVPERHIRYEKWW